MASTIRPNDILWTRNGDPVLANKINDATGDINLDHNFARVQKMASRGIKNGLSVPTREAFDVTLSDVQDPDKKKEIEELYQKINKLKESNADSRLVKYLKNELQFRMVRENYIPTGYGVNPDTLDI